MSIRNQEGSGPRTVLVRTRAPGPLAEWVGPVSRAAESLDGAFEGWRVDRVLLERLPGKGSRPTVELVLRQADRNTGTPSEAETVSICEKHGL